MACSLVFISTYLFNSVGLKEFLSRIFALRALVAFTFDAETEERFTEYLQHQATSAIQKMFLQRRTTSVP